MKYFCYVMLGATLIGISAGLAIKGSDWVGLTVMFGVFLLVWPIIEALADIRIAIEKKQ